MGIQSIIHTSYFIIHLTGFPGTLTPPAKQQSKKHFPDIEGMSFCPAHPLPDQPLEGGSAFRGSLNIGGVDDFVSLFIELERELKIFGNRGPPAESIQKVPADHVDGTGDLFEASVEFGSASFNNI